MMDLNVNKKNLILGIIGSAFMMAGDLTLSLITPCDNDTGLFIRQAYFDGQYPAWKLIFMVLTGAAGVFGYWYGLEEMHNSILPEYGKTRKCFKICSMFFCFTGLVIHYGVGIGAYEVSYLAQHFDEETARQVVENYAGNILPGFYILYIPIAGIFIIHLIMLIMKKTIYSRRMICFSPILLMGIFALIPDIRQALGCHLTTLDYVCSQCSGNVSPFLYFLLCMVLSDGFKYEHTSHK